MSCKYICVRESYDYIKIGDKDNELSDKQVKTLYNYLNEKYDITNIIEFSLSKIRFINYVGVISFDDVVIEILPKISLTDNFDKDRQALINMLIECNKIPLNVDANTNMDIFKSKFLDILAKLFIDNLILQVQNGIYNDYISEEENIYNLRGKLLFKEHIQNNYANKNKAYCRYDSYDKDNLLNRVFKFTCTTLMNKVSNDDIRRDINKVLGVFDEVNNTPIRIEILKGYKFNRNNERYKKAFDYAKLIISNTSSKNSYGRNYAFSILFEMNILFEEYIGRLVSKIYNSKDSRVSLQDKARHLLTNVKSMRKNISLRPDIVLYKSNVPKIIIDTKWKSLWFNGRLTYNQGDIYQMYAYVNAYAGCERCILIYPYVKDEGDYPIWKVDGSEDKYIEISSVRLDSVENSIEDLKCILVLDSKRSNSIGALL